MKQQQKKATPVPVKVSRSRVVRSIAGSTAIETGLSVKELEGKLKRKQGKFKDLPLAL